ncbi:P-loop containing nucleoside triphosphate hydrolase protein [Suillus clintonianus]|uniref:P-loop containing nucleoside triphosphate hydrolase protein n=1 Tax=Suillus clintonianus TaxID=1904413 RepID=UPI001B87F08A|nr:P-loop containing nucleoside triphosphate hydrolase protein [Suillus clintonianus]KAG2144524.1 P-loop containing nucleoside triphosphate hydrolase protein [Suillus clintonianus]
MLASTANVAAISRAFYVLPTLQTGRSGSLRYISSRANAIFKDAGTAEFLAAVGDKESLPFLGGLPEVVVTGRANVGKSSLLNSVVGRRDLLFTSKKAGRTQTLNFFRVGSHPGRLVVVDSPGYGARGRPEWGALFNHYLETRKKLCRVFILISAAHGMTATDEAMLSSLNTQIQSLDDISWTLQAIITRADALKANGRAQINQIEQDIFRVAPTCLPPIITSCPSKGIPFGIDEVRKSISHACGILP